MEILGTDRVVLRELTAEDAPFIFELVNDPDWILYIGDRGIRTLADACGYIEKLRSGHARHGFGLYLVERRSDRAPLGICGLLKRDHFEDPDIGFAFLPQFRGHGYGREAAEATLAWGRAVHGMRRIVAITVPENAASIRLLERIGLRFERTIKDGDELVNLYATEG
jgi:RimJ/RimL family protein N-acetyltransferase